MPTRLPLEELAPVAVLRGRCVVDTVRDALCAAGGIECMTLPFTSAADCDRIACRGRPAPPRRRAASIR